MALSQEQKDEVTALVRSGFVKITGNEDVDNEFDTFISQLESYKETPESSPVNKKDEWYESYYNEHIAT